ncbi:MAG: hypothetical protein J5I65_01815 [Aridibacter famidurans]|nr:hypothetical protein [Aridibacter famidurans]
MAEPRGTGSADMPDGVMMVTTHRPEEAVSALGRVPNSVRAVVLIVEPSSGRWSRSPELSELAYSVLASEPPSILLAAGGGSIPAELSEAFDLCFFDGEAVIDSSERILSASEAAKKGLINLAAPFEEARRAAMETAATIASLAPLAVKAAKQSVREGSRLELRSGLELENRLFSTLFGSEDMREGTAAFLEKRTPVFRGE